MYYERPQHSPSFLACYNDAGVGAIYQDRRRIARAIRAARKSCTRDEVRRVVSHATWVGWPVRKRPDGSYN